MMRRLMMILLCVAPLMVAGQEVRYQVSHLGRNVNTTGGESGAFAINDSVLVYASIQNVAEHQSSFINFDRELLQVFQAPIQENGRIGSGRISKLGFNSQTQHAGNVAYDAKEATFYFTRCNEDDSDYRCEIYVMRRQGRRWQKAVRLEGDVNLPGYTSTQPAVSHLADGRTLLFYATNRPGGMGGMDIWYAIITNGRAENSVCLGGAVNTAADEMTPFYDEEGHTLYFASNREGGMGGYDIYASKGSRNTWKAAEALPEPVNSRYNDMYFTLDEGHTDRGFFTSNREDSYFVIDSSCCNDIYRWRRQVEKKQPVAQTHEEEEVFVEEPVQVAAQPQKEQELLPVVLYFHNDEPDPGSTSDTTSLSYFQTWNQYMFLRNRYIASQPEGQREAMRLFFDEEVQGNCEKFERLIEVLASDLRQGRRVRLTVGGYASALHNNDYNQHLSQRRTTTILNQLAQYRGGMLKPYLGRQLKIVLVPYGSSQAAKTQGDPVWSLEAAKDRRIEVLRYEYE